MRSWLRCSRQVSANSPCGRTRTQEPRRLYKSPQREYPMPTSENTATALSAPRYRRVILKISGESFSRPGERGLSMEEVTHIARQTKLAAERGVQIAIVIGGGNILRGAQFSSGKSEVQEATAHYMGMLATVINGLALQDA